MRKAEKDDAPKRKEVELNFEKNKEGLGEVYAQEVGHPFI